MIGATALRLVGTGLDILYADIRHPLAQDLMHDALGYMAWVDHEGAIQNREPPLGSGWDWSSFYQAKAHVVGLTQHRTETAIFISSAIAWESLIETDVDEGWSEMDEAYHLTAIRLRLIAGDLPNARELLARHQIYWNLTEAKALKALAAETSFPVTSPKTRAAYRAHFDEIRDPAKRGAGFERLEAGLIWDRYFVSADQTIDWERAIEAIAE